MLIKNFQNKERFIINDKRLGKTSLLYAIIYAGSDIMSENFKKHILRMETYKQKETFKHKHNYSIKHLLIVTNINNHASSNNHLKKEYYYVLKCDQCNSFIPEIVEGNYQHHIFDEKDVDFSLPIITANTMSKSPIYSFSKLIDINVIKDQIKLVFL